MTTQEIISHFNELEKLSVTQSENLTKIFLFVVFPIIVIILNLFFTFPLSESDSKVEKKTEAIISDRIMSVFKYFIPLALGALISLLAFLILNTGPKELKTDAKWDFLQENMSGIIKEETSTYYLSELIESTKDNPVYLKINKTTDSWGDEEFINEFTVKNEEGLSKQKLELSYEADVEFVDDKAYIIETRNKWANKEIEEIFSSSLKDESFLSLNSTIGGSRYNKLFTSEFKFFVPKGSILITND